MPYKRQISILIERFGQPVSIVAPDESVEKTSAFIQPVQYKAKNYLDAEISSLGLIDEGVYLYIGKPNVRLPKLGEGYKIKTAGGIYDVTRSETVSVGSEEIYCWAVLKQRYENGGMEI